MAFGLAASQRTCPASVGSLLVSAIRESISALCWWLKSVRWIHHASNVLSGFGAKRSRCNTRCWYKPSLFSTYGRQRIRQSRHEIRVGTGGGLTQAIRK